MLPAGTAMAAAVRGILVEPQVLVETAVLLDKRVGEVCSI